MTPGPRRQAVAGGDAEDHRRRAQRARCAASRRARRSRARARRRARASAAAGAARPAAPRAARPRRSSPAGAARGPRRRGRAGRSRARSRPARVPARPVPTSRARANAASATRTRLRAVGQQRLPGGGEADLAGGALEQRHAELALQLAHRPRDRLLGHVQQLGGAREAELLGDRGEHAQMAQLRHSSAQRVT